jgi:hypothetical protein
MSNTTTENPIDVKAAALLSKRVSDLCVNENVGTVIAACINVAVCVGIDAGVSLEEVQRIAKVVYEGRLEQLKKS